MIPLFIDLLIILFKCTVYKSHLIPLSFCSIHVDPGDVTALSPLFKGITGGYWSLSQLSLGAKAGYTLKKSPAHRRALNDGKGHQARCQLHRSISHLDKFKVSGSNVTSSENPQDILFTKAGNFEKVEPIN